MLRNRICSNSGATILLALLFFLLCAMAGSVILTAGSAAAGRISGLKETEQSFYSVTSAAQVVRDEIEGQGFDAYTETIDKVPTGVYKYDKQPKDEGIGKILSDAIVEIYEKGKQETDPVKLTIHPSDNEYKEVMGEVTADFVMTDDYKIEITFRMADSGGTDSAKYVCKLTAKALIKHSYESREETQADGIQQIEKTGISVYWNECIIDKG